MFFVIFSSRLPSYLPDPEAAHQAPFPNPLSSPQKILQPCCLCRLNMLVLPLPFFSKSLFLQPSCLDSQDFCQTFDSLSSGKSIAQAVVVSSGFFNLSALPSPNSPKWPGIERMEGEEDSFVSPSEYKEVPHPFHAVLATVGGLVAGWKPGPAPNNPLPEQALHTQCWHWARLQLGHRPLSSQAKGTRKRRIDWAFDNGAADEPARALLLRAARTCCSRCRAPGATLWCRWPQCQRACHLPCAKMLGVLFPHAHAWYCEEHSSLQQVDHIFLHGALRGETQCIWLSPLRGRARLSFVGRSAFLCPRVSQQSARVLLPRLLKGGRGTVSRRHSRGGALAAYLTAGWVNNLKMAVRRGERTKHHASRDTARAAGPAWSSADGAGTEELWLSRRTAEFSGPARTSFWGAHPAHPAAPVSRAPKSPVKQWWMELLENSRDGRQTQKDALLPTAPAAGVQRASEVGSPWALRAPDSPLGFLVSHCGQVGAAPNLPYNREAPTQEQTNLSFCTGCGEAKRVDRWQCCLECGGNQFEFARQPMGCLSAAPILIAEEFFSNPSPELSVSEARQRPPHLPEHDHALSVRDRQTYARDPFTFTCGVMHARSDLDLCSLITLPVWGARWRELLPPSPGCLGIFADT
jgi:hypothetical protein